MALPSDNIAAANQINKMYQERKRDRGALFGRMNEIRNHYNGDIIVPLPELDDMEKAAVPNLIAAGIDQFAMRVASVMPDISYIPVRPGIQISENKARDRRLANLGWWDMNKMGIKLRRRARHLTAYGMSAVSLSPVSIYHDDKRDMPHWRVRNPLATYPAQMLDPDSMEPSDCIFADRRPLEWLQANYPTQMAALYKGDKADHEMFEVLEYMDGNETIIMACGAERRKGDGWSPDPDAHLSSTVILERIPNRAEVCPVVIAGRVTLDRLAGQFDQMLGMYQRQAKLDALDFIATFRNVFPDQYLVSPSNSPTTPRLVQQADGKAGIMGVISHGQLDTIHATPGDSTAAAMDRLERAQRLTAGIPAEFGGESPSNVRTARRGEMVMSNTVDMPIQEYQDIFSNSLEAENRRAVAIMKAYYGNKPSMFFMGTDGKIVRPDYTPNESFETDLSYVKYSMPGSDVNGMVIAIGQRVGTGVMSTQTAREMDPAIEDPIRERDQVEIESLRRAMLAGMEQQATQGSLDPSVIARIAKAKAERHVTLEDAVAKIHEEMQQEQAEKAQQMQQMQQQAQGMNGQPGQMPDMSQAPQVQPGMGISPDNPATQIQPPPQGSQDLSSLLNNLRRPARESNQEQGMMPGGAM
jgi:hypothetical protein